MKLYGYWRISATLDILKLGKNGCEKIRDELILRYHYTSNLNVKVGETRNAYFSGKWKKISGNIVSKFAFWEKHFIFMRIRRQQEGLG